MRTLKAVRKMPQDGFWSRKLPLILWLVLLNEVILINFANLRVVFGWGLWWVTLAFIANVVHMQEQREASTAALDS
jgi:hypothetical protein